MRHFGWLFPALLPFGAIAAPPPVGYAQATGYYKKDTRPTLYQPLNLLDGREFTAWCTSGPDPLNDQLKFGFKGPVKIDEVRIYTGNGADDTTFHQFSRAKRLSLKTVNGGRTFTVADERGLQAVSLNPPITGANFTMEVLDQYPAEDPDSPVCVTDIVFYSDGKPLNGPWLTPKLKYDRSKAPFLGTWYAGYDGAPERFLSFFFDGTYRLVYEPLDSSQKPKIVTGVYDASSGRVAVELPGRHRETARLAKNASEKRTLTFQGAGLPDDLKQPFRDAP